VVFEGMLSSSGVAHAEERAMSAVAIAIFLVKTSFLSIALIRQILVNTGRQVAWRLKKAERFVSRWDIWRG